MYIFIYTYIYIYIFSLRAFFRLFGVKSLKTLALSPKPLAFVRNFLGDLLCQCIEVHLREAAVHGQDRDFLGPQ